MKCSNNEPWIMKYSFKSLILAVLLVPYSYQYVLSNDYYTTRIVSWMWEFLYAVNLDPRFENIIRFIPLPTSVFSLAPILYIPTFNLLKVYHDHLNHTTSSRSVYRNVYVWSVVAILCPYIGYLIPQLVGWSVDYFISFPVGPILASIFTWHLSKDKSYKQHIDSPWIQQDPKES